MLRLLKKQPLLRVGSFVLQVPDRTSIILFFFFFWNNIFFFFLGFRTHEVWNSFQLEDLGKLFAEHVVGYLSVPEVRLKRKMKRVLFE